MQANHTTTADRPQNAGSFLGALFTDRTVAPMLGLGFTSGIPFLLVYSTQSAWLTEAKVPLATIGLLSELTLAYKFKFLWAPFLDRYDPPVIGALLGRRRAWIIVSQILVAATLAGVAFGDPSVWLWWMIAFSLALGVAGATQDVVIDGWRIAAGPNEKQALLSSWAEIGWRCGNLAAGAGALYLADQVGWRAAYLCMAALMAPGMIAALLAPEPETDVAAQAEKAERRAHGEKGPGIVEVIVAPIRELVKRLGPMAIPILVMVAGFRMPGYVSSAMAVPLFKTLQYSNSDIAMATKLFGFWVALGGTFLAGWLIPRIGMMASLVFGTIFGSASHLSLAYLAAFGANDGTEFWVFVTAVSVENFAYAFASIMLITYMSTLAASEHAASQYALLTSICAFPGSILAGFSGFAIERLGFTSFFVATSLIGIPVALLCVWVWRQEGRRGSFAAA